MHMARAMILPRTSAVVPCLASVTWVAVALVHPTSFDGSNTRMWLIVHIAQFLLAPVIALGVLGLLRGITGHAATLAKCGVVLWAVWFAVYDAVAGVSTGILAGRGMVDAAYSLMEAVVVGTLGVTAPVLWLLTAASTSLALRDIESPRPTRVAMLCALLVAVHAGLPAAVGFAALGVAFWSGVPRSQSPTADEQERPGRPHGDHGSHQLRQLVDRLSGMRGKGEEQ